MKPILFNTTMTQAILEGRKTVTRRKIDSDIFNLFDVDVEGTVYAYSDQATGDKRQPKDLCKYKTGEILYIRETWAQKATINSWLDNKNLYEYRADYSDEQNEYRKKRLGVISARWKPSIHMPKEAARIFLRVTNVRVERLQDITEDGAWDEGVGDPYEYQHPDYYNNPQMAGVTYKRAAFAGLWDSLLPPNKNKFKCPKYEWRTNPWVWVIEFERISKDESEGVTP